MWANRFPPLPSPSITICLVHRLKITWEKHIDFEIFSLKYVLKHFESIPTKNRPKFFDFVIFHYFGRKTNKSQEKNYVEKDFQFRDFRFKIRFETFWIDSYQRFLTLSFLTILAIANRFRPNKFRPFFDLVIFHYMSRFSLCWPFWPKTTESQKKFRGKKFSIGRLLV